MSNPLWPDPAAPFRMFESSQASPTASPTASSTVPTFAQGLTGGMDLIRKFWSNLPGGSALPGFLVPTVDLEELDKRLSDLRAAESWLEVNLNMLRATIQGLEVQRNTIAAIQSLSAMAEGAMAGKGPAPPAPGGLPSGWPAMSVPVPASPPAAASPPSSSASAPSAEVASGDDTPMPDAVDPLVNSAANNWLALMQQQFMKVAASALAPSKSQVRTEDAGKVAAKKSTSRSTSRSAAGTKTAARKKARPPVAR